ncbi:MAG: hypothetical protein JKY34_10395 [Kordiimonadaceae bacterium]|nr:hypothetical protein [Kordiimonadaceae bacterium]
MTADRQNVTPDDIINADEVVATPIWLWGLVVGLGIAIVGMLALIGFKVATGGSADADQKPIMPEPATAQISAEAHTISASPIMGFDSITIKRPQGLPLSDATLENGFVMLRFAGDTADTLILVNGITGKTSRIIIPK